MLAPRLSLRAGEPLLECGGQRGIAVQLDTILFELAAPHEHPVEAFARPAHGDVGLPMAGLRPCFTTRCAEGPFTLAVRAVAVETRGLALARPPLVQAPHQPHGCT